MRTATPALAVLVLVPLALVATGCGPRRQEPPPPPPAAPASIWTTTDAKAVATQLVDAASRDAWTSQFRDRNSRAARIAIGEIVDRSGKHIALDDLGSALRSALAAGGDKLTLADGPADFTLRGSIGASETTEDGSAVTWFAIDLVLVDANGDPGWHFAVERRVLGR